MTNYGLVSILFLLHTLVCRSFQIQLCFHLLLPKRRLWLSNYVAFPLCFPAQLFIISSSLLFFVLCLATPFKSFNIFWWHLFLALSLVRSDALFFSAFESLLSTWLTSNTAALPGDQKQAAGEPCICKCVVAFRCLSPRCSKLSSWQKQRPQVAREWQRRLFQGSEPATVSCHQIHVHRKKLQHTELEAEAHFGCLLKIKFLALMAIRICLKVHRLTFPDVRQRGQLRVCPDRGLFVCSFQLSDHVFIYYFDFKIPNHGVVGGHRWVWYCSII